jgi:SH3-like domain-containing protein
MRLRINAVALLLAMAPAAAHALDYRSVGVPRGVLYDAPSASAKKLFSVSQFYPVEVIVDLGAWVKVRDKSGDLAWIESKNLIPKRMLVAIERADVHEAADASASVAFRVDRDVALEMVELAGSGWVKVRHRDGAVGYLRAAQVWGL